jgi:hypothetical protein
MEKKGLRVAALVFVVSTGLFASQDWTWNYSKALGVSEARTLANKKQGHYVFVKENTPLFTQLIFSWNAHRPKMGHYTFSVQSRNAATKQWTKNWIKMVDWGNGIQRSHHSARDPDAHYVYVRLEELDGSKADAFKVRVDCNAGSNLADLRLLNVCISNMLKFEHEKLTVLDGLKSVELRHVPKISQFELGHDKQDSMCSTSSLTMLLGYLLRKNMDPLDVAENSFDNGLSAYGSWPFNTAHAFEKCYNNHFHVQRLPSFRDLYGYLSRGLPVIVSIRGAIKTAPQEYPNGHLILVCGLNAKKKRVVCHDPAFRSPHVRHEYSLQEFITAWERSNRLAYVVEPVR